MVMYIMKFKDVVLSVQFLVLSVFIVFVYIIVVVMNYEFFAKIMSTFVNVGMIVLNWFIFKVWIIIVQFGWFVGKIIVVCGGVLQVKKFCALNVFSMLYLVAIVFGVGVWDVLVWVVFIVVYVYFGYVEK